MCIEKDNIKNEVWCLKKNLNASRLSEHPTQGGNIETLRWDHRLPRHGFGKPVLLCFLLSILLYCFRSHVDL